MTTTAFVSTYPPQRCGIATFTADLASAVDSRCIVALHPPEASIGELAEVRHRIRRDIPADYIGAARWLDRRGVDVVSVQHEYGIWGGPGRGAGARLRTCPPHPGRGHAAHRARFPDAIPATHPGGLVDATAATVVMSSSAADS